MFGRKRVERNKDVAQFMRGFYRDLVPSQRSDPAWVAKSYGRYVYESFTGPGLLRRATSELSRRRYYVGLSVQQRDFEDVTKRTMLIADTLLLSSQKSDPYQQLRSGWGGPTVTSDRVSLGGMVMPEIGPWNHKQKRPESRRMLNAPELTGMRCSDMASLGRWILNAEPLLTAGMAWYLPRYSAPPQKEDGQRGVIGATYGDVIGDAIHYALEDGMIVEYSGAEPITSQMVRHIAKLDLPFIKGIDLKDFSRVAIDEYDSFDGFQGFLRNRLLDVDDALDGTQSTRELMKIELDIAEQVRWVNAELKKVRHRRALAATGATVGSTAVILVAVYGPAFQEVIATIGATGGLWGIIHAIADNSPRQLRDNKWYYIWVLSRHN
jgi:hypothetical protein